MTRIALALGGAWACATAGLALLACTSGPSRPPDIVDAADAAPEACPSDLPAACPAAPPSYRSDVLPTLQRRCWACHTDGGIEALKHDLGTYPSVFRQRGSILTQVYGCLMPLADASALSPDERAALLAWLVCGAPDN